MRSLLRVLAVAAALVLALWLRTSALSSFDMSPDEGNYLQAAWTLRLDGDRPLSDWIAEDREWIEHKSTYPHSYLHQWVIRQLRRLGVGYVTSVRLPSALLGTLTVLAGWLFLRSKPWAHANAAAFAAGFLALSPVLAWYSRTGWGQTGSTLFWLGYFAFAGRAFFLGERTSFWNSGWFHATAMALFGVFAWGYHEMISVHVACMGIFTLITLFARGPGSVWKVAQERKGLYLTLLVGALPVAFLTLRLFGQDFAEDFWLNVARPEQGGYFEQKWRIAKDLFGRQNLIMETGPTILILAVPGAIALKRRSRAMLQFIAFQFALSALIFFFCFQDAQLMRIYLPNFVMLCLLAGLGADAVWNHFKGRGAVPKFATAAALFLALLWPGVVSAQTILGKKGAPLAETSFYYFRGEPVRDNLGPIGTYLIEHRQPGELFGISDDYSPLFRLRDMGIPARMHSAPVHWNRPVEELPKYMLAIRRHMRGNQRTVETGGVYEELVASRNGRFGLFKNVALEPKTPLPPK